MPDAAACHPAFQGKLDTCEDALRFLDSLDVSAMKLGLDRVREVLVTLNNPQDALPMVHIAGTNGKGSVAAMLSSILKAADYNVGSFTSPHLVHVRERIAINGNAILPDDFQEEVAFLKTHLEKLAADNPAFTREAWPTYFEFLNVAAYHYFQSKNVDITVFETGLGGRLDSTNVVKHPNLTVITGIDFDHTQHLGRTLAAIAGEKAGILKTGTPLVLGPNLPEEARRVILEKAAALDVPVHEADADSLRIEAESSAAKKLKITHARTGRKFTLSLMAPYQRDNLATVLEAVALLRGQGFNISEAAVEAGLAHTYWPVRFQHVASERLLLDGSHNPQGFDSLRESLRFYFGETPLYWMLSLRNNRPDTALAELIAAFPNTRGIVWTKAEPQHLYYAPEEMAAKMRTHLKDAGIQADAFDTPAEALSQLKHWLGGDPEALGVVTGSLYTAGAVLNLIRKHA